MGQSQQKTTNQAMLLKSNAEYLTNITNQTHSYLGSHTHNLLGCEELTSHVLKLQHPQIPDSMPWLTLSSIFLVLEKKLCSFSIHRGLRASGKASVHQSNLYFDTGSVSNLLDWLVRSPQESLCFYFSNTRPRDMPTCLHLCWESNSHPYACQGSAYWPSQFPSPDLEILNIVNP